MRKGVLIGLGNLGKVNSFVGEKKQNYMVGSESFVTIITMVLTKKI